MNVRCAWILAGIVALAGAAWSQAAGGLPQTSAEPFKVGTFEIGGAPRVGLVLRDSLIVDLWDPLESTCRHASLSIL